MSTATVAVSVMKKHPDVLFEQQTKLFQWSHVQRFRTVFGMSPFFPLLEEKPFKHFVLVVINELSSVVLLESTIGTS